jgi:hypothetical protein
LGAAILVSESVQSVDRHGTHTFTERQLQQSAFPFQFIQLSLTHQLHKKSYLAQKKVPYTMPINSYFKPYPTAWPIFIVKLVLPI